MNKSLDILLVDDEFIVRKTLGSYLEDLGQHVVFGVDTTSALQHLQATHFDLTLVDLRLPDGDGLSIVEHVAQNHLKTACVVITAYGDMEVVIRAMRLGAIDFLTKPIGLEELEAVVLKVVSASESSDAPHAPSKVEESSLRPSAASEREAILQALETARWNRRKAATALRMPYSTLRYKMDRLGIR